MAKKKSETVDVEAVTDHQLPKGEQMLLWGILFESDGKKMCASVSAEDAKVMKDCGRAK